jgi:tetratricopeptide (TPR) repeat protein
MGALPSPELPTGPRRDLVDALHGLHHQAGWPSLREMAREVGCSHTTVSAAFSEPRVPRWGLLELLVETLDGDTERFHHLWLEASAAAVSGSVSPIAPEPVPPVPATAPRQLPAPVRAFIGREAQLDALDELLRADPDGGARLAVVTGTAGAGKTALVLRWAHRVVDRFSDGQLYLDLGGFGPRAPMSTTEALEALLRGLGTEGAAVPRAIEQRSAALRTLLADRRVLLVLDNAVSTDQVRALLPGGAGCAVVATSRTNLAGLVAREGARRVDVDLLSDAEAHALLMRLVGRRVEIEPAAAARLAQLCARLPLALRIAAELAAARPASTLADLVAELDHDPDRLDLLRVADDEHTAVRSVFSWSWRHLGDDAARAFRLIGLHAGADISLSAAAALLGVTERVARMTLDELVRANMLSETADRHYVMHDLLRGYAAESTSGLKQGDRDAALGRVHAHYLATASAAMAAERGPTWRPPDLPPPTSPAPRFPDPIAARDWLRREWSVLVATAESPDADYEYVRDTAAVLHDHLDDQGHFDEAIRLHRRVRDLAGALGRPSDEADATDDLAVICRRIGNYEDAEHLHRLALAGRRAAGDPAGQAQSLHRLGVLCWRRGRYDEADAYLDEAATLYAHSADPVGEGQACYARGIAKRRQGLYLDAVQLHSRAIDLLREVGDRRGEGAATNNLGVVWLFLGRYAEAARCFDEALAVYTAVDHPIGVAVCRDNLGSLASRERRFEDAMSHHSDALEAFVRLGYPAGQGDSHRGLGVALAGLGRRDEAVDQLEHALRIGERVGEASVVTQTLCDLGSVRLARGELDAAEEAWSHALTFATSAGDRYEQARAHHGLGQVHAARGDAAEAVRLTTLADATFLELSVEEASTTDVPISGQRTAVRDLAAGSG